MLITANTREEVAELARELDRQKQTKRDFICRAGDIAFVHDPEAGTDRDTLFGTIDMGPMGSVKYGLGAVAHEQFSGKLDIGWVYYKRLLADAPDLLATNANYWLERSDKVHLVRTLDGNIRAFLSDRYRVLDNIDLFYETYQVAKDVGAEITRADLTDKRFYMRVLHPEWRERIQLLRDRGITGPRTDDDGPGEYVIPGVVVSNSEVGAGGLRVEPFMFILACRNGMVMDHSMWKFHLGRRLEVGILSDETREAEDRALWLAVRDTIRATFDRDTFRKMVAKMNDTAAEELDNPVEAVDAVVQHFGFSDEDKQAILNELIAPKREVDPGRTVYGLLNAITAVGRDKEDYNRTIEFERIGGQLLADPKLVPIKVR